eukprot:Pgem_evm1s15012
MVYGQDCNNPVDYALLPQAQQLKYPNWKNTRDKMIQRWNAIRKIIIEMNHENKLLRKWQPKFKTQINEIIEILTPTIYKIKNGHDNSDIRTYDVEDLKLFIKKANHQLQSFNNLTEQGQDHGWNTIQTGEVERIVTKRGRRKETHYLVRFKGLGETEDTWISHDDLNCEELIKSYYMRRLD